MSLFRCCMFLLGVTVFYSGKSLAEPSAAEACMYFSLDHFVADNSFTYEGARNYEFGEHRDADFNLERYKKLVFPNVSVALFKNAFDSKPTTFLSAILVCLIDVKDRRVLEISVVPGNRIGDKIELDDGDYQFMIKPKAVHVNIGDQVHKGKY